MKYYILIIFLSVFYSCNSQNVSPEKKTYDKLFEKVSNKGKWGNKDKKGTVNYIDNNKILNALKLPEKGIGGPPPLNKWLNKATSNTKPPKNETFK